MPIDVASGAVYSSHKDYAIKGSFPLAFVRKYNSGLLESPATSLGPGWTSPFFSTLTRIGKDYRFQGPDGAITILPDPKDLVDHGQLLRLPGSFLELAKQGFNLRVTSWNVDTGEVVRYVFQPGRNGQPWLLRSMEDASGQGVELAWDENGLLRGVRQRLERRTLVFGHTGDGRLATLSYLMRDGSRKIVARYEYDRKGMLSAAFDAFDRADRYEYDDKGFIVRELVKDGGVFRFKYDEKGRCIRTGGIADYDLKTIRYMDHIGWTEVADSLGHVTRYQWMPTGQVVLRINPLGGQTKTEYDELGRIVKITDPMGAETSYAYDEEGNRSRVTDPLGNTSEHLFNADHLPVSLKDPAGNEWKKVFDDSNRLTEMVDPLGSTWKYAHDASGRAIRVENPAGAVLAIKYAEDGGLAEIIDWKGSRFRYLCDEFGRVVRSMGPGGETTLKEYDQAGNLVSLRHAGGESFTFTRNTKGKITNITDGKGRRTTRSYGTCGRLTSKTDSAGNTTLFTWGREPGRLLKITNPRGECYSFAHDAAGRVIEETGFDGRKTRYLRDAAGNCIGVINGNGEETSYALDKGGRVVGKTFPDGTALTFAFDPLGRLASAECPDGALALERDPLGRVIREKQGDFELEYRYDSTGDLAEILGPLGYHVAYARDRGGSLVEAAFRNGRRIQFEMDGSTGENLRMLPGGGRFASRYDAERRAICHRLVPPEQPESREFASLAARGRKRGFEREYVLKEGGSIVSVTDSRTGRTSYDYDESGRIRAVARTSGQNERFEYDSSGNLIRMELPGHEPETLEYGAGSRLKRRGVRRYDFDAQGRLTSVLEGEEGDSPKRWTLKWDALDQLRSVGTPEGETWSYGYDPLGRRISKKGPGTDIRYIWDRHVVIQTHRNGEKDAAWFYGPNSFSPLCKETGGHTYSILPDHLGTPLDLVDEDGEVVRTLDFHLWGGLRSTEGGGPESELRFPGQWHDSESGFHYNRFRYYDPGTGRYISQDPIRLMGGKNLYAYGPDPVNWFDPYGLVTLYRGMLKDADGNPVVYSGEARDGNNAANSLGVRPSEDAMSTSTDPADIQSHRRPASFGGTQGRKGDPDSAGMFAIDSEVLAQHGLVHDNDHDNHVGIKTAEGIDPAELPERLAATRDNWEEVTPADVEARRRAEQDGDGGGCGG